MRTVSGLDKSIETNSLGMGVEYGDRLRFFGDSDNVLNLECGDGCINLNMLKSNDL